jgi:hypothetical protein
MYCQCGCGEITPVAKRTRGARAKGSHSPYIRGHSLRGVRKTLLPPPNPTGICQCGCGQRTSIAKMTNSLTGTVAGEHVRFIQTHGGRREPRTVVTADMWQKEDRGYITPCWICTAVKPLKTGYCTLAIEGRRQLAHRVVYRQFMGEIPAGLELDHLCRQPACVRPDHLEAVTHAENIRRGYAAKRAREAAAASV